MAVLYKWKATLIKPKPFSKSNEAHNSWSFRNRHLSEYRYSDVSGSICFLFATTFIARSYQKLGVEIHANFPYNEANVSSLISRLIGCWNLAKLLDQVEGFAKAFRSNRMLRSQFNFRSFSLSRKFYSKKLEVRRRREWGEFFFFFF